METQSETCAGLFISALLEKRALLAPMGIHQRAEGHVLSDAG